MRTLAVGDIHGKLDLFNELLVAMNYQPHVDFLVLIGDLVDRGENSKGVVERSMQLKQEAPETVVILKGNHEVMLLNSVTKPHSEASDGWLRTGGLECLKSYTDEEGNVNIPQEHIDFMQSLPHWYEDDHAIYVHASLPKMTDGSFLHPSFSPDSTELMWGRNRKFFNEYDGKLVVFGHTIVGQIFGEWGQVWEREDLIAVDTGAYMTGILSAVELPGRKIYQVGDFIEPPKNKSRRDEKKEPAHKTGWFGRLFGR
jgi:serine/threonine protein phosphatase 1